jgi:cytochrome c556
MANRSILRKMSANLSVTRASRVCDSLIPAFHIAKAKKTPSYQWALSECREFETMKKFVLAACLVALGTSFAFADAIGDRQTLMKNQAGATKALFGYAKGDAAWDAAKVKELLQLFVDDAAVLPTLFPDGSDKGDTTASPKIWEDMAGFKAKSAAFGKDAKEAQGAADAAALGEALKKVTGNCQSCHEAYRIKKG